MKQYLDLLNRVLKGVEGGHHAELVASGVTTGRAVRGGIATGGEREQGQGEGGREGDGTTAHDNHSRME